ncbi:hypothetical protein PVAG01_11131 [Phlyctema vagabunda]|uniref:Kazal-like domain-containing protein n=1 Tax=Phlyctema vagabunda TaxID=108571 RepID=A0ABR4P1F6_9HELO
MAGFTLSRLSNVLLVGLLLHSASPVAAAVASSSSACPTITSTAVPSSCPSNNGDGCFFPQIIELKTVTVPCGCPRTPATTTSYVACPTQDCYFITPTSYSTKYAPCKTKTKRAPGSAPTTTAGAPPCVCKPGVLCNCLLPTPTPTTAPAPSCPTIATTGGPALCKPLKDCITLACVDIKTATLPCGCDKVKYTSTCQTACTGGCGATQWETARLPCPTRA